MILYKKLLTVNDDFALYEITEEVFLDEAGIYETSYNYEEIIDVERIQNCKVRVKYTYLKSLTNIDT